MPWFCAYDSRHVAVTVQLGFNLSSDSRAKPEPMFDSRVLTSPSWTGRLLIRPAHDSD